MGQVKIKSLFESIRRTNADIEAAVKSGDLVTARQVEKMCAPMTRQNVNAASTTDPEGAARGKLVGIQHGDKWYYTPDAVEAWREAVARK